MPTVEETNVTRISSTHEQTIERYPVRRRRLNKYELLKENEVTPEPGVDAMFVGSIRQEACTHGIVARHR